jgi:hypothetical protein
LAAGRRLPDRRDYDEARESQNRDHDQDRQDQRQAQLHAPLHQPARKGRMQMVMTMATSSGVRGVKASDRTPRK